MESRTTNLRKLTQIFSDQRILLLGFSVQTEYTTSSGRIDLLIKTKRFIYVIELKLNGSSEDALRQIEEKGYAQPFATDPRTLFKIGVSFSSRTRNIDHWIIQRFP